MIDAGGVSTQASARLRTVEMFSPKPSATPIMPAATIWADSPWAQAPAIHSLAVVVPADIAHQSAMVPGTPVDTIAASIQLAVTPIFLLTGVGSILNVLVARLGRVTDRARKLEAEIPGYPSERRDAAVADLSVLSRRMAFSIWAIALCTCSALLVCVVVAILFIGELFPMRWTAIVAVLFVLAMALLIAGLTLFLLEVQIALRSVRIRADVITGN